MQRTASTASAASSTSMADEVLVAAGWFSEEDEEGEGADGNARASDDDGEYTPGQKKSTLGKRRKSTQGKAAAAAAVAVTAGVATGDKVAKTEKPKKPAAAPKPAKNKFEVTRTRVVRLGISLHDAVRQENMAAIAEALFEAEDINMRDAQGRTALFVAVQSGRIEMVKTMVNAGCDVNATCAAGDTPLHVAARNGSPGIIRILIRQGADLDALDADGRTPLEVCKKTSLHSLFFKDVPIEEPAAPQLPEIAIIPRTKSQPKPKVKKQKSDPPAGKRRGGVDAGDGVSGPPSPDALGGTSDAAAAVAMETEDPVEEPEDEEVGASTWEEMGYEEAEGDQVDEFMFASYFDPYATSAADAMVEVTAPESPGNENIMVEVGVDDEGIPLIITASMVEFPVNK